MKITIEMTTPDDNSLIQHFLKESKQKQENIVTDIPLNVLSQSDNGAGDMSLPASSSLTVTKDHPATSDDTDEIETTPKVVTNEIDLITPNIEECKDVAKDTTEREHGKIKRISVKVNHTIFRCIECTDDEERHLYFKGFKKFHLIPEKDLLYSELLESYRDKVSRKINGLWYRVRKKRKSAFIPITWRTYLVDYIYLRHEVSCIVHGFGI